ncbi:hypothetical protein Zm00014a_030367 [Zea mays]|uniref:Uncharacterized protein n=1 Tax=Zea mays TaxID=4577 RepID=A0A317Y4N6_MAIZE|nr:hypothetical protein Zm00014a_030367 [Zea mays]
MAYLMLQMVDLVTVFSGTASPEDDGNGDAARALGLAQMVVGLTVGVHYYAAVFYRAPRQLARVRRVRSLLRNYVRLRARREEEEGLPRGHRPRRRGVEEELS